MTTHPPDPAVVGSFAIEGRLGRGAMGAVYLGRSPGGRLVAVKVVRDELAGDAGFRSRFAREIDAARKVSGAFTAAVIDADAAGDPPWLATEYLPGPTLQKAIGTRGALPAEELRSLAVGLAEALRAIHACGLVHRDLKPSNILLTANGPRVIDFGIARALEETSLTATGVVVGTPGYLSPEQITGAPIGPASDVFALGAVLVFAASGRGPFADGSPASLLHRAVNQQPHIPPLPGRLDDVVRRCLSHNPGDRPTPAEILQLLAPNPQPVTPATKVLPPEPIAPRIAPGPEGVHPAGATFATDRGRVGVLAAASTVFWLGFMPRQGAQPGVAATAALISLGFFCVAVRFWVLVCRRRVILQVSPFGVTVVRGKRRIAVPWAGVMRLRVEGDGKRPWLIAWVGGPYDQQLLGFRRHHGGVRLYPIGHGIGQKRRLTQVNELRAALNWYAGRLHDNSY